MKKLLCLFCIVFVVRSAFGQNQMGPFPWTAMVKVVDENGQPIEGANISVGYSLTVFEAQAKGKDYDEIAGLTDAAGEFTASHSDSTWDIGIDIHKAGYYNTHTVYALLKPYQADTKRVTASRNLKTTLLLKKIGKPIPMYARVVDSEPPIFKKTGQPPISFTNSIGYDLMVGDWIAPYGTGINTDMIFTEEFNKKSLTDFYYKLTISFPNPKDGIQEFFIPDSEKGSALRSPHEAPMNGYQSELIRENFHHPGQPGKADYDPNRIYLFRVRTKLDVNGNIVSAHYGKIYGDPEQMNFIYYLNSTPNDRNIEFDPKQNLLSGLKPTEQVSAP